MQGDSTQTEERWLTIADYEGIYSVSDLGRVRRDRDGRHHKAGRILAGSADEDGYRRVVLRREGIETHHAVHRLVLESFVGPCPEGMQACHFPDRDPGNNQLVNLRWDTQSSNQADRVIHGTDLRGERVKNSVLTEALVREVIALLASGAMTHAAIGAKVGTCRSNVSMIKNRTAWKHVT